MKNKNNPVKKIIIASAHPMVRQGLEMMLKKIEALNKMNIVVLNEPDTLGEVMLAEKPIIVFVSPTIVGGVMVHTLKEQSSCQNTKMISINELSSIRSDSKYFDAKIYLTDTTDDIEKTITKLFEDDERAKEIEAEQQVLTPREKDIVVCVVKGLTNKEIAEELFLSTHTVITHRRNIAKKLQIHSPAGLTIYAIVNKLVELKDIKNEI